MDEAATVYLHGVGHFHPNNIIDNAFLESLDIGTNHDWIMERVGIQTRRTVLSLDYIRTTRNRDPRAAHEASQWTNAQTGASAARVALQRAGLSPSDIGMVIAGGCSSQWSIPAEACVIAAELGIAAPAFDVSSACSSFAAHLQLLHRMRPEAMPDYVLVVQPENTTRTIDYSDRRAAVLWGDASSAAIVSARIPSRAEVVATTLQSDPLGWDKVKIPAGGHFEQDGSAVQAFAIRRTTATLLELRKQARGAPDSVFFIGHQANGLVLEGVCRRCDIDETHHLSNVREFGNCGAAGAPSVLSTHWESFGAGAEIALVVVGAGLTWGGLFVRMTELGAQS